MALTYSSSTDSVLDVMAEIIHLDRGRRAQEESAAQALDEAIARITREAEEKRADAEARFQAAQAGYEKVLEEARTLLK